jgi:hypothetical protein
VVERSEQITEYAELAKEKRETLSAQLAPKAPFRPEGGDRAAARDLGLTRDEVRRAEKIANITPEAKQAAHDAGLDNNQSRLLAVAATATRNKSRKWP